jgi:hypothetical protein
LLSSVARHASAAGQRRAAVAAALSVPPPVEAAAMAGDTMTSNPHEVKRASMGSTLTGNYVVGPGRFQNQASQTIIYLTAPSAVAHQQKHAAIAIFTPSSPGMPPMIMGVLQAPNKPPGAPSNLVLNLMPVSSDESRVLPTRLAWSVNGSSSTGIFKGASGAGIVALSYTNDPGPQGIVPGSVRRGLVTAHFSGLVHTTGVPALLKGVEGIVD